MSTDLSVLPQNRLVVRGGKLYSLQNYTLWNGEPWCTIEVVRQPDRTFLSQIGDPEHGGGSSTGSIETVTGELHPNVRDPIIRGFSLEEATEASLQEAGLIGYEVVLIPERKPCSISLKVAGADETGRLDKPVEKSVIIAAINKFYERTYYPPVDDVILDGDVRELGLYSFEIRSSNGPELIKLWVIPEDNA